MHQIVFCLQGDLGFLSEKYTHIVCTKLLLRKLWQLHASDFITNWYNKYPMPLWRNVAFVMKKLEKAE